jgi:ribonuclease P protein component
LESRERYFYGRKEKLKSRKAIGELFSKGFRISHMPYRVYCLPTVSGLQAAIGASSNNLKKATDRNRIKRLMREAYRLQKNELERTLSEKAKGMQIFFLFAGKILPAQNEVMEDFNKIIKRLIRLSDENSKVPA